MSKLIGLDVPDTSAEYDRPRRTTLDDWRVFTTGIVFNTVLARHPKAKLLLSSITPGSMDPEMADLIPFQAHPGMATCEVVVQVDPAHNLPYLLRIPIGILALDIQQWPDADRIRMTQKATIQNMDAWRDYVDRAEAAGAEAEASATQDKVH